MSDTNVIGLGPNPLMSFGNTVAQPVPSSYRQLTGPALIPVVRLVGIYASVAVHCPDIQY